MVDVSGLHPSQASRFLFSKKWTLWMPGSNNSSGFLGGASVGFSRLQYHIGFMCLSGSSPCGLFLGFYGGLLYGAVGCHRLH